MSIARIEAGNGRGASWREGDVVVSRPALPPPCGASRRGGRADTVDHAGPARDERSHRWPHSLAGGKCGAVHDASRTGEDYDERTSKSVDWPTAAARSSCAAAPARITRTGLVALFAVDVLYAAPFDAERLEWAPGPARPVLENLMAWTGDRKSDGSADFAWRPTARSAYCTRSPRRPPRAFVWVDPRAAVPRRSPSRSAPHRLDDLARWPSRGHRRSSASGRGNLASTTSSGGLRASLSTGGGETTARWSADSRWFAYSSTSAGEAAHGEQSVDGGLGAERSSPRSASRRRRPRGRTDGRTLYVDDHSATTRGDICAISLDSREPPRPVVQTADSDGGARVSPNGRWLLYFSDESGIQQVYVRPFATRRLAGRSPRRGRAATLVP